MPFFSKSELTYKCVCACVCVHVWISQSHQTVIQLNKTALSWCFMLVLYRMRAWSFDRCERVMRIETETGIKSNVFERFFFSLFFNFFLSFKEVCGKTIKISGIFLLFWKTMMKISPHNIIWKCPSKDHPHQNQNQWKLKTMIFFHYLSDKKRLPNQNIQTRQIFEVLLFEYTHNTGLLINDCQQNNCPFFHFRLVLLHIQITIGIFLYFSLSTHMLIFISGLHSRS